MGFVSSLSCIILLYKSLNGTYPKGDEFEDVAGIFRYRIETHTGKPVVLVEQIAELDERTKQGGSPVMLKEMAQAFERLGPGIIYWYAVDLYVLFPFLI